MHKHFTRFTAVAYRSHDPRWAFTPTSGKGAARHGGRFNPQGQHALYLSLSQVGALIESQQGFPKRAEPKLICSYDVDINNIIDLTDSHSLSELNYSADKMTHCAWLLESKRGNTPYTWQIFEQLYAQQVNGIIVHSSCAQAAGMKNLVLWRWSDQLPNKVKVIDPQNQLPSDQSSWTASE
jgi:RES domain-containing protein